MFWYHHRSSFALVQNTATYLLFSLLVHAAGSLKISAPFWYILLVNCRVLTGSVFYTEGRGADEMGWEHSCSFLFAFPSFPPSLKSALCMKSSVIIFVDMRTLGFILVLWCLKKILFKEFERICRQLSLCSRLTSLSCTHFTKTTSNLRKKRKEKKKQIYNELIQNSTKLWSHSSLTAEIHRVSFWMIIDRKRRGRHEFLEMKGSSTVWGVAGYARGSKMNWVCA